MSREPETAAEWQEAVDAAHGSLALASASSYGLVVGGPQVNVSRCEELLERGRELAYTPGADAIERFAIGLAAAALS